ncbi:MAG: GTPase [Clostridiales bacterium]|jgi:GTP-binding protein|nr:GTPase [Clostridiales bacterium]MDK2932903.1 GTPase [Clostridiales bacterium]
MSKPIVALVGRPNVGKSTLFNKIIGQRISIVEDTPGVTRDRIYAEGEWLGRIFTLIDTGGIEPTSKDEILTQMRQQAEVAVETSHVIVFLVDVKDGLTASDKDVANMLIKSGKPIVLACNKVDNIGEPPLELYEFYNLGLGEPIPISSIHGLGIGDLLDAVAEHFPDAVDDEYDEDIMKVAIIGKPNAGKSSLVNKILGENRVIVSDVPGTTRDAIDTYFEKDGDKYIFIDTAGMRKKGKIFENIERYSVIRSLTAIERSNVCLIMIDASEGVTEQDTKIAGFAHEQGKASIIVINKWDLIEKDDKTMHLFRQEVMNKLSFMTYAPIAFISAKTGQRIGKLFELIKYVADQHSMRISTGMLNDIINEAVVKVQPPSDKGKRLKILYVTQASVKPPTFVIFVNDKELMHFSYQRYIENQIRSAFGLEGTPLRFIIRERSRE